MKGTRSLVRTLKEKIWSCLGFISLLKNIFHMTIPGIDLLKVLYFFLVGHAILKDFSYLFGAKFTCRKILPVTSWQLTNRTVSDISRVSRHIIRQSFFPAWISNMIQIHSGETSLPRDLVVRSFAARPHALKLALLTFKNLWEVEL